MRYIIGIDLGTTNSSLAYIDSQDPKLSLHSFKIPQNVAENITDSRFSLPSFYYLIARHEELKKSLRLPWEAVSETQENYCVGAFAQIQGSRVPTQLIQSAKSWLCHPAINRRDKILPLEVRDEKQKKSPVEVSASYLLHLKNAWNSSIAKDDVELEFDNQEIILTVPASFDEVARGLTVEAARMAGFVQMTLLEEPQAAFYSWIAQHEKEWEEHFKARDTILVCDVGGGTTDFSLIEVITKEDKLAFQRMSVGNHLLLGGDNMDRAVAHFIENKLNESGHELDRMQRMQVLQEARLAKEKLLGKEQNYRVIIQGSGSKVVQGTTAVSLNQGEIQNLLLNGFFSFYPWEDAINLKKASGFRSMGLPYEDEPSITKHLASFLAASSFTAKVPVKPKFILFNGGAMKPLIFQEAILKSLNTWFPQENTVILPSHNLDLAVSRGAAYYGKVRRGLGVRISGGSARGYYLVLDTKNPEGNVVQKALTLIPRTSEEGYVFEPDQTFLLSANQPVSFKLCTSNTRIHDQAGDLIDLDLTEMNFLPAIQTILKFGKGLGFEINQEKIAVHLRIKLTPIGTVEIVLNSLKTKHQWVLEFQIRSTLGQDNFISKIDDQKLDQTFQLGYLEQAKNFLQEAFNKNVPIKLSNLMEKLEEMLGSQRKEWPLSVLRGLFDVILQLSNQRKISLEFFERWWNCAGFLLRPGFGYVLDDFRVKELWKIILSDFKAILPLEVQIQMWICFRRISGGLSKGQQTQLASDLLNSLFSKNSLKIQLKSRSDIYPYSEKIRALASFEFVSPTIKAHLGSALVTRIVSNEGVHADFWALGRIGARHLLYGSIANVVSPEICEKWIDQLLKAFQHNRDPIIVLIGQLARKTQFSEINLSNSYVEKILSCFSSYPDFDKFRDLLTQDQLLTQKEQELAFGDTLPSGLLLEFDRT